MIDAGREYAGLVTRAVAFAIDIALIDLAAIIVGIVVGLGISAFELPDVVTTIAAVIGAVAFVVWWFVYFALFWSTTGQTPGARVMGVRVVCEKGGMLGVGGAIVRLVGMALAAIPLFAGFLLILFDQRRRGLQDMLARTIVVYV